MKLLYQVRRFFGRESFNDQRGVVLLLTVLFMVVLLVMVGLAADVARVWVARENLQTAVDAASLAGARRGERYVTVTVLAQHCEDCCIETSCCCCKCDGIVNRTGTEKYMLEKGGWGGGCDIFYGIEKRFIKYPSDTESTADEYLKENWPYYLTEEGGGEKVSSGIEVYETGKYAPSVKAEAEGKIKTTLLNVVGISEIPVKRCGQSGTFYEEISGGYYLGRLGAPADACR